MMGPHIDIRNNNKEGIVEVDSAIRNGNDSEILRRMFSNVRIFFKNGGGIKESKGYYITRRTIFTFLDSKLCWKDI